MNLDLKIKTRIT